MTGYSSVTLYLKKGFKSTLVIDGEVERQIAREGKLYLFFLFLGSQLKTEQQMYTNSFNDKFS